MWVSRPKDSGHPIAVICASDVTSTWLYVKLGQRPHRVCPGPYPLGMRRKPMTWTLPVNLLGWTEVERCPQSGLGAAVGALTAY